MFAYNFDNFDRLAKIYHLHESEIDLDLRESLMIIWHSLPSEKSFVIYIVGHLQTNWKLVVTYPGKPAKWTIYDQQV